MSTVHPALSRSFRFQTYCERGFPRKNILLRFFIFFRGSIPRKKILSRFFFRESIFFPGKNSKTTFFRGFSKIRERALPDKQTAKEDFRERKNRERAGWTVFFCSTIVCCRCCLESDYC